MVELSLRILAFACGTLGMAWLALSMVVHFTQVRAAPPSPATSRTLRLLGAIAIASSLALDIATDHASIAPLVWIMTLVASALLVAFTLAFRPRWLSLLVAPGWMSRLFRLR